MRSSAPGLSFPTPPHILSPRGIIALDTPPTACTVRDMMNTTKRASMTATTIELAAKHAADGRASGVMSTPAARIARAAINADREETFHRTRDLWKLLSDAMRIGAPMAVVDAIRTAAAEAAAVAGNAHRAYAAIEPEHAAMIAEARDEDERRALGI